MRRFTPIFVLLLSTNAFADDAKDLVDQADSAMKKGDPVAALKLADQAIAADSKNAGAYDLRGTAYFKLGKIKESLADFDKFIALEPGKAAAHWRRGLTLYYADEFAKGVAQFTTSDKAEPEDVENAVWHFLCDAKVKGLGKARSDMLKVQKDPRGPYFMKIYDLFRGTAKPEDVLAETEAGTVGEEKRKEQRFYANYYIGMYYECVGEPKKSLEHLKLAVEKYPIGHYMMDVAKVHIQLRSEKTKIESGKKDHTQRRKDAKENKKEVILCLPCVFAPLRETY